MHTKIEMHTHPTGMMKTRQAWHGGYRHDENKRINDQLIVHIADER